MTDLNQELHDRKSLEERFHANYIPEPMSGCWLWEGHVNKQGYGLISNKNKATKAHRISWELHNGPIPRGKLVCHTCDTPSCVNPDHLFIGTYKDNTQDAIRKGRSHCTKFTWQVIDIVRSLHRRGASITYLSKKYNVHISSMSRICNNKSWIK